MLAAVTEVVNITAGSILWTRISSDGVSVGNGRHTSRIELKDVGRKKKEMWAVIETEREGDTGTKRQRWR